MSYLDTSALVALFNEELSSQKMIAWFEVQDPSNVAISSWCFTEFSSAVSKKVRMGYLNPTEQSATLAAFREAVDNTFHVLSITHEDFVRAAIFANQHALNLRAGDALHAAIAYGAGLTLVTFDQRLAHAARNLGVVVTEL